MDVNRYFQGLASNTSRRSVWARVGAGLIGASLLLGKTSKQVSADCSTCGGCGSEPCAGTNLGYCPGCFGCNGGIFCDSSLNGACPAYAPTPGWYWYCCTSGDLSICQDCCDSNNACQCTSRGYLGFC